MSVLAFIFGLVTGGIVWEVLDKIQVYTIGTIVSRELDTVLQQRAREALIRFDHLAESYSTVTRLLANHRRLADYPLPLYWRQDDGEPVKMLVGEPPVWLPEAERWRPLVDPSHLALLDATGRFREVYQVAAQPLPGDLAENSASYLQTSRKGPVITVFDERPYLLASALLDDVGGESLGAVMLVVPISAAFLNEAQGGDSEEVITAVFDGAERRVIVSSDAERLTKDADLQALEKRFAVTARPLDGYGQDNFSLQFLTLVPRSLLKPIIKQVSSLTRHQRATGAIVFVIVYTLLFMFVSHRLARSLKRFATFSQRAMGFSQPTRSGGNQLLVLDDWMRDYIRLVRDTREEMRARHQTEIQESTALRSAIMEASLDSIITIDSSGRIIDFNPTAERSFGYSRDEALGSNLRELIIAPASRDLFQRQLDSAGERKPGSGPDLRTELMALTQDGVSFPVELAIKPIDLQGRMLFTVYLHDISERRRREEEMRALAALPSESPDPILRVNRQSVITYANDASEPLLSAWGSERGQTLPPSWRLRVRNVLDGGASQALEININDRIYSLLLAPIRELDYVNLYARDITEERLAEVQSRQHQTELVHVCRLSTMGEMATGIAHELNQPLSAIANYASGGRRRMESGTLDSESLREALNQIAAQAGRAGEIIRRFRALVSRQPTSRAEISVNDLVTEVLSFVDHELRKHAVSVETILAVGLPPVRADLVQIEQVILNLVRNAMDAVKDNELDRRKIHIITSSTDPHWVKVSVEDEGGGLSEAAREHLFEPFFTTKQSGMGMGLAISQTIAKDHGGKISADSRPGGGASFSLELPVALQQKQAMDS